MKKGKFLVTFGQGASGWLAFSGSSLSLPSFFPGSSIAGLITKHDSGVAK
jgi:hypothetical protein